MTWLTTRGKKKRVIKGWENKAMGLLQVLWERGFINPKCVVKYAVKGCQDACGVVQNDFLLQSLMGNCQDFDDEESLLQLMGREMGIVVDQKPKCHCKVMARGVEYLWGCTKNAYCCHALKQMRGKESFQSLVHECLLRE